MSEIKITKSPVDIQRSDRSINPYPKCFELASQPGRARYIDCHIENRKDSNPVYVSSIDAEPVERLREAVQLA